jgi:hypothetical protein
MNPLGGRATGWSLRGSAFAAILVSSAAVAGERINKDAEDVAIRSYDTVAYFTHGRPVEGSPEFEHIWQEARWWFASAEHRRLAVRPRSGPLRATIRRLLHGRRRPRAADPDRPRGLGHHRGPALPVLRQGGAGRDRGRPGGPHRRRRGAVGDARQDALTGRHRQGHPIADRSRLGRWVLSALAPASIAALS